MTGVIEVREKKNGALERTRTFTPLGAQPPQGCVSTNSTTSAPVGGDNVKKWPVFYKRFFCSCVIDALLLPGQAAWP